MTAPDRTWSSRARCTLGRHRPLTVAAATGITAWMPTVLDLPWLLLAVGAVLFVLGVLTDGLCRQACAACFSYRSHIEAHTNAHLPALALWHKVSRPWWRLFATTITIWFALAFGGGAIPVVLLGFPAEPTLDIVGPLAVFTAFWWTGHHKRLHELLSDVCPYCR